MTLKLIWGGFALVGVGLWFAMWFGAARWNGTTSQFVETLIQAIPRGEGLVASIFEFCSSTLGWWVHLPLVDLVPTDQTDHLLN